MLKNFEIRSAKQFIAFIVGFILSGAAWLWASWKVIDKIVRGRR